MLLVVQAARNSLEGNENWFLLIASNIPIIYEFKFVRGWIEITICSLFINFRCYINSQTSSSYAARQSSSDAHL